MGAALRKPLDSVPPVDEVLTRLPNPARAYVHLHFVAVACLASRVSELEEASGLLRACFALRVALGVAATSAGVNANELIVDLSNAALQSMSDDFAKEPDHGRVDEVRRRISRLNARLHGVSQSSPAPAPGPAFYRYVVQSVVLDAALILVGRARAEEVERGSLLDIVEQLLSDLEGADSSDVLLPGIGQRPDPLPGAPRTGLLAEDVERAAEVAFACEGVRDARELVALGREWYPEHVGLARLQEDIAPPVVTARSAETSDREAWLRNRAWVEEHGRGYAGQWIAVTDGKLCASATRLVELPRELPPQTLVTRVRHG